MTEYLDINHLKNSLSIGTTTNESKLLEVLTDANNEINKVLSPYADDIPIPEGGDLFVQCTLLANIYAQSRWYRDTGQLERAESDKTEYDSKKESFVELLISQRTNRTEIVFVTDDDALEQVYQPYNVDEYLTRLF